MLEIMFSVGNILKETRTQPGLHMHAGVHAHAHAHASGMLTNGHALSLHLKQRDKHTKRQNYVIQPEKEKRRQQEFFFFFELMQMQKEK